LRSNNFHENLWDSKNFHWTILHSNDFHRNPNKVIINRAKQLHHK
jgi:hypothetical protein